MQRAMGALNKRLEPLAENIDDFQRRTLEEIEIPESTITPDNKDVYFDSLRDHWEQLQRFKEPT